METEFYDIGERKNQSFQKGSNNYNIKIIEELYKVCKISIDKKDILGSGFFIKLKKNNKDLYCLMTNEHVITKEMVREKEIVKITIEKKNKSIIIELDETKRFIRSFDYMLMDIIIIEILPSDNIGKDFYFKPNLNYQNEPSKIVNKMILVAHYAKGLILRIDDGKISKINLNTNEFIHKASTDKGSSGGLIIELNDNNALALGIHKQGSEGGNIGHFIYPIFKSLENDKNEYIEELIFKEGIYRGEIINHKREGFGEFKLKNGEIYKGQWKKGKRDGYGIEYYSDNDNEIKYKGYFKDNEYHGKGEYKWENGEYYKGNFENSRAYGEGLYHYLNGDEYKGNFVNGFKEGKGTYTCKNGNYFFGEWKNDFQNGIGELYVNKKLIYKGMVIEGTLCGNGIEFYSNGKKKYEGEFYNNKYHGSGKLYLDIENKYYLFYDGEWKYGKKSGAGVEYFSNGKKKYEGEFDNDKYHKKGKLYINIESKINGNLYYLFYDGDWKYDQRSGYGFEYYSDGGKKYVGDFDSDKYHGKGALFFQGNNKNINTINYEGEWKFGLKCGKGKEFLPNRKLVYEGLFDNNKYKKGKLYFKNGYYFSGNFDNGKMNGKGVLSFDKNYPIDKTIEVMNNLFKKPEEILDDLELFAKNALKGDFSQIEKYEGNFVNNNKEGFGICYYKNGACYRGEWKNKNMMEKEDLLKIMENILKVNGKMVKKMDL